MLDRDVLLEVLSKQFEDIVRNHLIRILNYELVILVLLLLFLDLLVKKPYLSVLAADDFLQIGDSSVVRLIQLLIVWLHLLAGIIIGGLFWKVQQIRLPTENRRFDKISYSLDSRELVGQEVVHL